VERIAALLSRLGLDRAAEVAAQVEVPDALWQILVLAAAIAVALALHALIYRVVLARWGPRPDGDDAPLVRQMRGPSRLVAIVAALAAAVPGLGLAPGAVDGLEKAATLLLILAAGWGLIALVDSSTRRALRRFRLDTEDNLRARKYATQLRVLRRAAVIVIGLLTAGAALLTFEGVRQVGLSLFASAGAAGLILGLAARPVLANLIAGIQIALTQPIRIDDVVIVDGEWGWVEEIYATYVVVKIWDWRRMVVPLAFFIEQPFQNWTRESANIIGAVFWCVDYTVPIEEVRKKMEEIVRESALWDGQVVVLQVTDTDKDTMTLRGLMSARTSPRAWDLRCEVREKLLVWLQATYPGALPRLRGELDLREPGPSGEATFAHRSGSRPNH